MHSGSPSTPENPAYSLSIGIAALIIEGRPLYDNEYVNFNGNDATRAAKKTSTIGIAHRYNPRNVRSPLTVSSTDNGIVVDADIDQPLSLEITETPNASNAYPSSNDSVQHLERLRHKLNQIRSLPSTSRDTSEQSVAVSCDRFGMDFFFFRIL